MPRGRDSTQSAPASNPASPSGVSRQRIECHICKRTFVYAGALRNHFTKNHTSPHRPLSRKSRAERAAVQHADKLNLQHSPLLRLPSDILVLIMQILPDFSTLRTLLLTAQRFSKLFRQSEKSICGAIARRKFPPEAIALLNYWRKDGLPAFNRQLIDTHPFFSRGRWIRFRRDRHLEWNPEIIGVEEVKRLVYDSMMVARIVHDWGEIQMEWHNEAEAALQYVAPLRRWHDRVDPLRIAEEEKERVRLTVYRFLLLTGSFYPEDVDEDGEWDVRRRGFDYTALKNMGLRELMHLVFFVGSMDGQLKDFRDEIELDCFLFDRCLDKKNVKDWQKYVEELRDVQLKCIWNKRQGKVNRLLERIEEGGYEGGLNMRLYEEVELPDAPGMGVWRKRTVLRLKEDHQSDRTEWNYLE